MQVVINKCFLPIPKKNLAQICLVIFEKNAKNIPLIPKNDVIEPKARRLSYFNSQLKTCSIGQRTVSGFGNHAVRKPETDF